MRIHPHKQSFVTFLLSGPEPVLDAPLMYLLSCTNVISSGNRCTPQAQRRRAHERTGGGWTPWLWVYSHSLRPQQTVATCTCSMTTVRLLPWLSLLLLLLLVLLFLHLHILLHELFAHLGLLVLLHCGRSEPAIGHMPYLSTYTQQCMQVIFSFMRAFT